ncbi:MAG TPA: hypothetical protein VEJ89_06665 [Myxococcaceae bacterium]|nr:hypothetical protein [Myxococcaceae bacterium]
MRRLLLLPVLAAALLAGCKGNCRQLAEQLCNCAANLNDKNACLQRVANRASVISPSSADDQLCGSLINGCDCHTVNTVAGKYACGLARQPIP